MHRAILGLAATFFLTGGAYMLIAPGAWYEATPGVPLTGPYNVHFVRDIGLAFLASGAGLAWAARRANGPVAIAAAVWPCLHALFHIQIWFARGLPLDQVAAVNLAAIQLPAWLALWAAWHLYRQQRSPHHAQTHPAPHDAQDGARL